MAAVSRSSESSHPERQARAGLRTFFRIAEAWRLSIEEQMTLLGLTSRSTYFKYKREGADRLSPDLLERLSYLFGIYKNLQVLLPDPIAADGWVRKPNDAPLFNGQSALERMLSGRMSDLYLVRKYLDAERGGWS
jgi:hypothetical protein